MKQAVFRDKNREKLREFDRNLYQKNKENILLKRKELLTCECGSTFLKVNNARHKKSVIHLNYLNEEIKINN